MEKTLERPIVSVDVAVFTIEAGSLKLALLDRERAPFAGRAALVGGYIRPGTDRDATAAAHRILARKAGLSNIFVEQLMTFSGAKRDPRGWSVSIAYYALVPVGAIAEIGTAPVSLVPASAIPALPFDHNAIAAAALKRLRSKASYSSLPAFLLPATFTFPELKGVYETVMGESLNDSAFRRKIGDLGIIEEVAGGMAAPTAGRKRPTQLYRLRQRTLTEFDRTV